MKEKIKTLEEHEGDEISHFFDSEGTWRGVWPSDQNQKLILIGEYYGNRKDFWIVRLDDKDREVERYNVQYCSCISWKNEEIEKERAEAERASFKHE